jgi:hypothetical protein
MKLSPLNVDAWVQNDLRDLPRRSEENDDGLNRRSNHP